MNQKSQATLALAFIALISPVMAQAPKIISYQGRLTDASNNLLGVGTPVNRAVIFRIHSAASGGSPLWSEQHTVTIANGDFSVLLGTGVASTFGGNAENPRPDLDTIFTGESSSDRYLEIVVDTNANNTLETADGVIAPRQRMTSAAYAFRSALADNATTARSVLGNNDLTLGTTDYGVGYYGTAAAKSFAGQSAINGTVIYGLNGGALGSTSGGQKIALAWNGNGEIKPPLRFPASGTAAPTTGADGGAGTRLVLWPGSASDPPFGFGINSSTLWTSFPSNAAFRFYGGTTERLRIGGAGGVFFPGGSGADPANGGSSGNFIAFGTTNTSEDYLGYNNNTFFLADSPGGGDGTAPSLNVGGNLTTGGSVTVGGALNTNTVTVAGKSVPNAEENLRIIRGTVSSTGAILVGSGFTVTKPLATGNVFTINFSTAFSASPTVTTAGISSGTATATVFQILNSSVEIITSIAGTGSATNFNFIAIGPR
jgi:hypothetical protein